MREGQVKPEHVKSSQDSSVGTGQSKSTPNFHINIDQSGLLPEMVSEGGSQVVQSLLDLGNGV